MSEPQTTTPPRLRLRVTAQAEAAIRDGHPWVYEASIREQNREAETGELAVIYDRHNRFLAIGLYDAASPIRVRVLHHGKPATLDLAWFRERLVGALVKRRDLEPHTTGARLVNGESDGWPGLVLDRYADTGVVKIYTAAWLPRLEEIGALIRETAQPARLVLRLSRNIQAQAAEAGLEDGRILFGEPLDRPVIFEETGIRFEADVLKGQKTGFFLDQRENRRMVGKLARGRAVLNAFSFSGGFSLYAARGGAAAVTDIDISPHALRAAERNRALNMDDALRACPYEGIQADVFEWLKEAPSRQFELVILDPPSLAKREAERGTAIRAYGRLAASGIAQLRRGGILAAASCSAHVSTEEFFGAVREAARRSNRRFQEMRTTGHAPDHPATFPEARYLKCIYLAVE